MATELAKAYVQILPSTKGMKGQLTNLLAGDASAAGSSAGGLFSTGMASALGVGGKLIGGAFAVGTAAIGAATAGLTAFAQQSVTTGMEFDSAMSQVAATMDKPIKEIAQLRDFAQEMGATTAFTATQAAEGLKCWPWRAIPWKSRWRCCRTR